MAKVAIVYGSRTGQTERVARVIAEGVAAAGGTADLMRVDDVRDVAALVVYDALAVGSSTQEAKALPEVTSFLDRLVASGLRGKPAAAFGSYAWSGEAPRIVGQRLERECGMTMVGAPLKARGGDKDMDLDVCRALGEQLVAASEGRS